MGNIRYTAKMNKDQAGIILNSMIEFIEQSGKERCEEIQRQAKQDFAVGKEQAIENEKKRLKDNFENKLVNAEVQLKIKKSAQQNKARIDRMRPRLHSDAGSLMLVF